MFRDEVSREQPALTYAVCRRAPAKGRANDVIQISRPEPDAIEQHAERAECWPARQY